MAVNHDIHSAKYVSFTTFRRNGQPVSTPVWLAALGDGRYGFTTSAGTGKVKRINNNPQVNLTPCSSRGAVADTSRPVAATAEVVSSGHDYDLTYAAIRAKYGISAKIILNSFITRVVRRQDPADICAVVVTLAP